MRDLYAVVIGYHESFVTHNKSIMVLLLVEAVNMFEA